MQDAIKSILGILEEGSPELRIAAAQILGELRPSEVAVVKQLAATLDTSESYLHRHVLTALSNIQTKASIRELVARVGDAGNDGDLVVHLLRSAGDEVGPLLSAAFDDSELETRARILEVLESQKTAEAAEVMEKALYEPGLTHQAAAALVDRNLLDAIPAAKVRYFKDRLKKRIAAAEDPVEVRAELVRVLAKVDGTGQRALLVKLAEPDEPTLIRAAALHGLRGVALTPTQAAAFLEYLTEQDLEHVVEPSMALLVDQAKWTDAGVAKLRKLLSSRRDHLRLFAIRAFRNVPKPEVVKTLIHHLLGEIPEMSAAASEALSHNESAADALFRAFTHEKDPERARILAVPLAELGEGLSAAQCKNLLEKGCKGLIAHEEMGEALLTLLLRVRPDSAAGQIIDKAQRLRRARKVPEALVILLFLATGEHLDQEGRYQLAVTRLLADGKPTISETAETAPSGDATMGYFSALVRECFPVLERLKKESMVLPEALLRIGRHFATGVGNERRFGSEMLEFVAEKHGKQRAGEEARHVLRAGGL